MHTKACTSPLGVRRARALTRPANRRRPPQTGGGPCRPPISAPARVGTLTFVALDRRAHDPRQGSRRVCWCRRSRSCARAGRRTQGTVRAWSPRAMRSPQNPTRMVFETDRFRASTRNAKDAWFDLDSAHARRRERRRAKTIDRPPLSAEPAQSTVPSTNRPWASLFFCS